MTQSGSEILRVDKIVSKAFPTLTNRHIEEALDAGFILGEGGKKLKKGLRISANSVLDYKKLIEHLAKLQKGNPNLKVKVESEGQGYWVISKPAGMPSHPISLLDFHTVTHWAFAQDPKLANEFPETQPTLSPHRLDTDTEGLLIVSKDRHSYEGWRSRFQNKEVIKKYLAWVQGNLSETKDIHLPIAHEKQVKGKMRVVQPHDESYVPPLQEASSSVSPIRFVADKDITLVEVTCTTGVTHQVRVHLASLGHPLVGDKLYDAKFIDRNTTASHHLLLAFELTSHGEKLSIDKNHFFSLF